MSFVRTIVWITPTARPTSPGRKCIVRPVYLSPAWAFWACSCALRVSLMAAQRSPAVGCGGEGVLGGGEYDWTLPEEEVDEVEAGKVGDVGAGGSGAADVTLTPADEPKRLISSGTGDLECGVGASEDAEEEEEEEEGAVEDDSAVEDDCTLEDDSAAEDVAAADVDSGAGLEAAGCMCASSGDEVGGAELELLEEATGDSSTIGSADPLGKEATSAGDTSGDEGAASTGALSVAASSAPSTLACWPLGVADECGGACGTSWG